MYGAIRIYLINMCFNYHIIGCILNKHKNVAKTQLNFISQLHAVINQVMNILL